MIHVVLLIGCAVVIYLACEAFVNAVEWLGERLKVGALAVGTVLAALGTALPESVVTLVAVVSSGQATKDIGVGAALGGPLVVGTIAYAVTGAMLLLRNRRRAVVTVPESSGPASVDLLDGTDTKELARDQTWFLAIFVFKFALGLVAFAIKPWLGLVFFAAYGVYVWRQIRGTGDNASADGLEPLTFQRRRATPTTFAVVAQTIVTLIVIFAASQLFVAQLEWAGPALGLSPVVVALLLAPVATELPEILNAVIWVRQGKTRLALANISGAMMIQATVPSGLGLLFTSWKFDVPLILAATATLVSVIYLRRLFSRDVVTPRSLLGAGLFYVGFAVALVAALG
ncbi:MAG: sodium/calcium exchanger rane protein [Frankiales bacterium]|nr:sodium/calcium exchanger rane protein [Frankiales bacterium]